MTTKEREKLYRHVMASPTPMQLVRRIVVTKAFREFQTAIGADDYSRDVARLLIEQSDLHG